jgi:hypothetical protein
VAARIGGHRLKVTKKKAREKLRIIHSRCSGILRWRMRWNAAVVVVNQSRDSPVKAALAGRLTSKKAATPRLLRLVIHAAQR